MKKNTKKSFNNRKIMKIPRAIKNRKRENIKEIKAKSKPQKQDERMTSTQSAIKYKNFFIFLYKNNIYSYC